MRRYKKLNEALAGVVEDYGLVAFMPLDIQVRSSQPMSVCFYLSQSDDSISPPGFHGLLTCNEQAQQGTHEHFSVYV